MKTLPESTQQSVADVCMSEMIDTTIMKQSLQKMFDEFVVFISKSDFE